MRAFERYLEVVAAFFIAAAQNTRTGREGQRAKAKSKSTLKIRVIRADGTIEDLGVVSRHDW